MTKRKRKTLTLYIGYPPCYTLRMTDTKKRIIDHISRLEGQLASVKNELRKDTVNCAKASTTLLSAARSFAGLRQKFTETFLMKHFVPTVEKKDQELFEKLTALIKG